jgi:phospholipid/cholesterol/gamma-HCH transport system substrate-binding protein
VLSDANIAAFSNTMRSLEQGAATFPDTMRDASLVVADLKATLVDVRAAAAAARELVDTSGPNLAAASERIKDISDNLAKTTAQLDTLMTDHRQDLGAFLRDSLPEIERLLRDSRVAAQEFRELSRSLKSDPSQLLYEPSYRGVEIPR